MKKISLILLFVICVFSLKAQNNTSDPQVVQMLKEFYTAYNTAWASHLPATPLIKKLDSLQTKYCTIAARKELKKLLKASGLDHDALTNDEGTDVEHLKKTLKITKDPIKTNDYIVSYIDHTMTPAYKPIDKTVIIHVTVVKENGSFKIDNAYGDAISLR